MKVENMAYLNKELIKILASLNLGSGIAEEDSLLEDAKIETSVFSDLLRDRVDLIPGTKGSGKSALYRIFVEFLPEALLDQKKIVIAHGVDHHGDSVFHAYKNEFEKLSEDDFVDFWCIYFVSLVHEQFIKNEIYKQFIENCQLEISQFRKTCELARIPEITGKKSLKDILNWCLNALRQMNPTLKIKYNDIEYQTSLFGEKLAAKTSEDKKLKNELPLYVNNVKIALENILIKSDLNIWLMVDRLDEIFPRRSEVEKKALRGLLRTTRYFSSNQIKIKIFLRDDIFENIVNTKEGFTALTHVTSRKSDTLRWNEVQIQDLILRRLISNKLLQSYLKVDLDRFNASASYRSELFYQIFPGTIYKGERQSTTLRWIYSHSQDGNGVVTPRDIIFLVNRAKQKQYDILNSNSEGSSECIIDSQAILYAHEELSMQKRVTFLQAEFPHLWVHIDKLIGGKTQYRLSSIKKLFGKNWEKITSDLISIGVLCKSKESFDVPFLYRKGLETSRGLT